MAADAIGGVRPGGLAGWAWRLREQFGARLLVMIFCTHHLLKGFVGGGGHSGLVGSAMEFTYRGYGVTGPDLQVYSAVALLPWSMKATMGLMSDGFPLWGYRKAPYLVVFAVLAVVAYLLLGFSLAGNTAGAGHSVAAGPGAGAEVEPLPIPVVTCGFFIVFFQMALSDLLVEAKYSEKVKRVPEGGPELITFVWAGMSAAGLLATATAGWLIDRMGPAACYLLAAPFAAALALPAACNFLEEERLAQPRRGCCSPDAAKWRGHGLAPFLLALAMGTAGLALALFSVFASSVRLKFCAAAAVGLLNLLLFSVFMRPSIARINAFFFLQNVFHVGTHGASFYFFTDNAAQYPEGPHFSARFFVTTIGSVAAVFSLVGMACYSSFGKTWRYRSILVGSSLAFMVVNCLSAAVFLRLNLRFHIPDRLFMVASSAMQSVIGQLSWMPMTMMLAQLVPDGLESTMYALLAGSVNLGMAVANYAGAFLLESLGVRPHGSDGEGAQFENLWVAALISACGPCVPLVLVPVLIPDACQTDRLLQDGDPASATVGSLFERWRAAWLAGQPAYGALPAHGGTTVGEEPGSNGMELPECSIIGKHS